MFPEEFLSRLEKQCYLDQAHLVEALGQPAEVSIRINRRKWPHQVNGYKQVPWEPDGYYLTGRPFFTADPLFHAGAYYPQEASSMFTGEVFRQVTTGMKSVRVLDLCGAPGGKSTHLSALMGSDGLLVANEVIGARAAVLAENITKWGLGNAMVTQNDPSAFTRLQNFFDVMVADVPCSGEGMFRNHETVREWSAQNAVLCSLRQRRIVMDAWPALRPGGILIYSTCTFNPAENEENISWLREQTGSDTIILDVSMSEGITPVRFKGIEGYGFYPGRITGDGFFVAVLRKPGDAVSANPGSSTGRFKPVSKAHDIAGRLIEADHNRIVMDDGRIICLAADSNITSYIDSRLTVVKYGTVIGEWRHDSLVPAHDLAMSVNQKPGAWPEYDTTYEEAVTYLQLGHFRMSDMPAGRILMRYRSVPLGFINNLGNRFNNGYPRAWRIRSDRLKNFDRIL